MSQTCLFILVAAVLAVGLLVLHYFSKYFKHSGTVVAFYGGGSLVNTLGKVVFVRNPDLKIGQKVKLHSSDYPPFKKYMKENPHRPVCINWALIDKDGDMTVYLLRRINTAQWIATANGTEIFVDLDNDEDYHFADGVKVEMSPRRIQFEEYCLTE